jgi:tripartite ATP-independent transporter DctP family solute receptor
MQHELGNLSRRTFAAGLIATAVTVNVIRTPAATAATTMKFGHDMPSGQPGADLGAQMWSAVKAETHGAVDVQAFPNSQLGSDPAMLQQLRSGAIQFMLCAGGILGAVVPVANIEGVGYAFKSPQEAWKTFDGALGAYIRKEAMAQNIVVFPKYFDNGMRQVTTSAKAIAAPADFAGLKIRTPPAKLLVDLFKALGASPSTINPAEMYVALQTHVVDASDNGLGLIETQRLYDVQKHLSLTNHSWAGYWLLANGDVWKTLSPSSKAVIARNADKYALMQRRANERYNEALVAKLRSQGMVVNTPPQAPFRAKLGVEYYAKYKRAFGDTAWSLLEKSVGKLG